MALLSGLSEVEWAKYQHAYGPATDVPGLLRAIVSDDNAPDDVKANAKRRKHSVFEEVQLGLLGSIVHQGAKWAASVHVVPFILELLRAGLSVERRRFLVSFLDDLAMGEYYLWPNPFELEKHEEYAAKIPAANLPEVVVNGACWDDCPPGVDQGFASRHMPVKWALDCHLAVQRSLPELVPFLDDKDYEVAGRVIALFGCFPRARESSAPVLWSVVKTKTDSALAGMALISLSQLGEPGVPDAAKVLGDVGSGKLLGLYAAAAEVFATNGAAGAPAMKALRSPKKQWLEQWCPFGSKVVGLQSHALARAGARIPG